MNIEKIYDYRDESEQLLYQVVRYKPKDFRQRRPDDKDGWIWNLDGVRCVPYRLPELLKSSMQDFVFIAEGEKDCDRLSGMGFTATTCPMGAGKWLNEYNKYFEGRLVVILPDNDTAGKKHA
ncbi:MAG: topoisomerase, partial [Planctomycetota bacterium]|nr:topoisomerase [Planctomycetota bacterium]